MEYIRITKDSIDAEHICCAMSGKQALAKKDSNGVSMRNWSSIEARNVENASSNTSPRKTRGFPSKRTGTSISTACGSPAP